MNQEKIGKFILKLRTEKNLSQYQLADMIPISRQAVSKWERGESIPDSPALLRLSKIFDVTINELLEAKRIKNQSIKSLETTTLNILDESNRKTKKLKRNFIIYTTIIVLLLLSFLSYYFINSYNQTKVYLISGHTNSFKIRNGLYLSTRGKDYLKIGNIEYDTNIEIKNIKLYYKKNNKNITISEAKDLENFVVMDLEGYYEIISQKDKNKFVNNSYIDITYNDNVTETMKLKFIRDFSNNKMFFNNKKKLKVSKIKKEEKQSPAVIEVMKTEDVKVKPRVEYNPSPELVEGVNVSKITEHDTSLIDEIKIVDDKTELQKPLEEENLQEISETQDIYEKVIDIQKVIENIKLKGILFDDSYIYASDDETLVIFYYEDLNKINTYINDEFAWDYFIDEDRYNCANKEDCKEDIIKTLKEYLYTDEGGN